MPPKKRRIEHLLNPELPAPLTSRNLRPRNAARSLSRATSTPHSRAGSAVASTSSVGTHSQAVGDHAEPPPDSRTSSLAHIDSANPLPPLKTQPSTPPIPEPAELPTKAKDTTYDPLSSYSCPICYSPPTNATLTPCGHVLCGPCLFAAVKTALSRNTSMSSEPAIARCPVCRASIPGWDGIGGGVIGLKIKAMS